MKKIVLLIGYFFSQFCFSLSISQLSDYPRLCWAAAQDDELFKSFKKHPSYQPILEHLSFDQGNEYLFIIEKEYPFLIKKLEDCGKNDSLGNPFTYYYGENWGELSPGTLRYMKTGAEILSLFGDLSHKKIVEIGVGYGGQCKILSSLIQFDSYTLIDLPEVCSLAKKYLDFLEIKNTSFIDCLSLPEEVSYDLIISNYAFSEISKESQIEYIDKIINKSKSGYMICNFISDIFGIESLTLDEVLERIALPNRKIDLIEEKPLTHPKNIVITWKEIK